MNVKSATKWHSAVVKVTYFGLNAKTTNYTFAQIMIFHIAFTYISSLVECDITSINIIVASLFETFTWCQ